MLGCAGLAAPGDSVTLRGSCPWVIWWSVHNGFLSRVAVQSECGFGLFFSLYVSMKIYDVGGTTVRSLKTEHQCSQHRMLARGTHEQVV